MTDEMFVVCRTILADPKRWSEFGHRAAEAYWEAHRDEPIQTSDDDGRHRRDRRGPRE
ncbi:hypothetical protein GS416_10365 [Rhodococcus hoagii]|nr:hypothetical protein [Prescottella equi]